MATFTVRVELHHSACGEDYKRLHSAMADEGFRRTITSSDGIKYQLPTAEYNRIASLTKSQVLGSAKRAARTVGKPFSAIVTESAGQTWYNLDEV